MNLRSRQRSNKSLQYLPLKEGEKPFIGKFAPPATNRQGRDFREYIPHWRGLSCYKETRLSLSASFFMGSKGGLNVKGRCTTGL